MLQLVRRHLPRVLSDRRGVSAMEYAALGLGIVVAVATAAAVLGRSAPAVFGTIASGV
jgi:Flp pilus assembly pilin Flp